MSSFAKVLLPLPFDKAFDYAIPQGRNYNVGELVMVPFGRKQLYGVIWGLSDKSDFEDKSKIKSIISSAREAGFEMPNLSQKLMDLIEWQADYTITPKGLVLSLALNDRYFKKVKEKKKKEESEKNFEINNFKLNGEQQTAFENIEKRLGSFSVTLLEGITGSGKTEVYFEAVAKILDSGKQALIMLPEILLTSQMIKRFEKRFGFKPMIWHSVVGEAKRRKAYFDIANGKIKVVVGARSALHLPYKNLGIIIVDEEHDDSYKQEDQVVYNARDIAVLRGKFEDAPVILSSATPSIETYYNAINKKYFHEKITQRFNDAQLAEVELIDMRIDKLPAKDFISNRLRAEIRDNLSKGLQSLLFLNRRGYAPLTICGRCGFRFKSPDTSAWMVMHMNRYGAPYLQCHHSGHIIEMPKACPNCKAEDSFRPCGPGVQRVAEEVKALFPNARIMEMASDTTTSQNKVQEMIEQIEKGEVDIIIGTQIIAKGHHFPSLSLVGVIDGDLGLDFANLRSHEKVFQLLHQVSGRAGRDEHKGKVYIQTFQSENKVMQALVRNDLQTFLEQEVIERKEAGLPPFSRLCAITISAATDLKAAETAKSIISKFERNKEVRIFGPAPALYHEYRGQFRYRILIKTARNYNIQKYVRAYLDGIKMPAGTKMKIDVDPYSFS
jgi:primosomal protein N' (replication factor Y)